jgi:uncharacterized protein (TIGR02231 family)
LALLIGHDARAGEIVAASKVSAATLFPDGGLVTRLVEATLPAGAATLRVTGLPSEVEAEALIIEGEGEDAPMTTGVEIVTPPATTLAADPSFKARRDALKLDRARAQARGQGLRARADMAKIVGSERMLTSLAEKGALDVEALGRLNVGLGETLAQIGAQEAEVDAQIQTLDASLAALDAEERASRPAPTRSTREAWISLETPRGGGVRLRLTYPIRAAGWTPTYEARLSAGEAPRLTLTRRAQARQSTGEDWEGAALSFATTRASRRLDAPGLASLQASVADAAGRDGALSRRLQNMNGRAEEAAPAASSAARSAADEPAWTSLATEDAALVSSAYSARFDISAVSLKSGETRSLRLSSREISPKLVARVSPQLDLTAYLEARFVHEENAGLPSGEVMVFRDGAFVGRTKLAATEIGGEARLGLGADDRIKITRTPDKSFEKETGPFGKEKRRARSAILTARSSHAAPVVAIVTERIPFSAEEDVKIEATAKPAPTRIDPEGARGLREWTLELKPGETQTITTGYRVAWPADRELTLSEPRPPGAAGLY